VRDSGPVATSWAIYPGAKEKNAAQKAATALLDALAPEPAVVRGARPPAQIVRHRTPGGCVLQAPDVAVSVSWFPESAEGSPLGELRVIVWDGVVVRRGASSRRRGATVVSEMRLRPIDPPQEGRVWMSAEGKSYDTPALAALCLGLLEQQIRESAPDEAAGEASD
jgi:hypothetical protein